MSTPAWAPTLSDVGGCITTKTLNINLPGDDRYLGTFNNDTQPNATEAQVFIDDACEMVEKAVTSIPVTLEASARNAAKWRAAADIELAFPQRNADMSIYAQLDARAKLEWERFLGTAGEQGSGTEDLSPVWYMPDPVTWGEDYL